MKSWVQGTVTMWDGGTFWGWRERERDKLYLTYSRQRQRGDYYGGNQLDSHLHMCKEGDKMEKAKAETAHD